ncbi:transposase [Neobacillus sp. PS2-9]|uniref:REP-associated tyrosine transposase n=1 Tax=Neobacillus sp. PS2-9 TaxID=3070676 RepID=UPI0027E196B4|nr:transposase [Neobacillus sp. PS2-9]WML58632.1 transposase [Neobacillus sp. PS2-9]
MSREKRVWINYRFYHIVCRGNRRDPLFRNASDFEAFLHILHQLHKKYPFEIAAYCLMTNHYHLQIRSQEVSFSKVMGLINKRYANYYNTKYRLTGHVFEKRFHDSVIADKEGMLEVSRYIHSTPVKAKMVNKPEYYPWSSYPLYKNTVSTVPIFMNMGSLLNYYEGSEEQKKEKYCHGDSPPVL